MSKKGARAGKGNAGARRGKDAAMSASMRGTKRNTMRCPVCNKMISVGDAFENHIRTHR